MNRREILKQLSVIPLVGTTMTPDFFAGHVPSITEETKENIWNDIVEMMRQFESESGFESPCELLICTATK